MYSYKLAFWIWDSPRGKGREVYTKLRFESHSKTFGTDGSGGGRPKAQPE